MEKMCQTRMMNDIISLFKGEKILSLARKRAGAFPNPPGTARLFL
jgi:hypothetical protein